MRPTQYAVYLYHVVDVAGHIRYVGLATEPHRRLHAHLREAKHWKYPLRPFTRWLLNEALRGRMPTLHVIREAGGDYLAVEQDEIHRLQRAGQPLINCQVRGSQYRARDNWICDVCESLITVGKGCPTCDPRLMKALDMLGAISTPELANLPPASVRKVARYTFNPETMAPAEAGFLAIPITTKGVTK